MTGIGIGTFALIVVLSAFNGIENLVESLYSSFDPAIKITASKGKAFNINEFPKEKILALNEIEHCVYSLEETALLNYRDKQHIGTVKGVEDDFLEMSGLDSMLTEGNLIIEKNNQAYALIGYGVSYFLSLFVEQNFDPITIYSPRRTSKGAILNPDDAFKKMKILPSGIFSINADFDNKYIIVPLWFAQELLQIKDKASSAEIALINESESDAIKSKLKEILGDDFVVKTRYELNEIIYQTNNTEKWITFLILSFILVIAAFNLIGSLTMLIIDKKNDIQILKSMGANQIIIKRIFILEGVLISFIGGSVGLVLGLILCKLQQWFGLVKLSGVVVDTYPVLIKMTDVVSILGVVLLIGFVSSYFPVKFVLRKTSTLQN